MSVYLDAAHLLHLLEDELTEVAWVLSELDTSSSESLVLALGSALATADDGTSVTHPLAWWGGSAGDEGDDWLLLGELVLGHPLGSIFLGLTTDFTDEDDTLCVWILSEPLDDVGVELSGEWITTDADDGRLTEASEGGSVGSLVGQGAGPRDDTDLTWGVDAGWDDTHLAVSPWLDDTWAVWTDELDAGLGKDFLNLDHVVLWDVLGDADNKANTALGSLDDSSSGSWSWDEDEGSVSASSLNAISNILVNWKSGDSLTCLLGVNTTNNLGAVFLHEFGVELTLLTKTLNEDLSVLIDEKKWLVECSSTGRN